MKISDPVPDDPGFDIDSVKAGDIVWQRRLPGGECLVVKVYHTWDEYKKILNERLPDAGDPVWSAVDFPIFCVLHPREGLIQDPSYYYETLEEAHGACSRF